MTGWNEGPDVSHHQGLINWQTLKAKGAQFAIIRASYGGSVGIGYDTRVDENVAGAKAVALPFAFYHYYHPKHDPKAQAAYLLNKLHQHAPFGIAPIIDLEEPPTAAAALLPGLEAIEPDCTMGSRFAALDAAEPLIQAKGGISEEWYKLAADAYIFLSTVRDGLASMEIFKPQLIYTNLAFWNLMGRPEWGKEFDLHLAAWTTAANPILPPTWDHWAFWQYTNSASGKEWGASSDRIDLNRFFAVDLKPYLIPPMPPKPDQRKVTVVLIHPSATREQAKIIAGYRWSGRNTICYSLHDMQTLMSDPNARQDSELIVFGYYRFTAVEKEIIQQYNYSIKYLPKTGATPGTGTPPVVVTPPTQPAAETIDLRRFKIADPDCWRVLRMTDGRQEDVQDMDLGGGVFVRRKGSNGEWHKVDGQGFWLIHDTSPDKDTGGIDRCYTLYKDGKPGAQKSKLVQAVGEKWTEVGVHTVQFRAKSGCLPLAENSGAAVNSSEIVRYEKNYTFNKYGQGLTFEEVAWEKTGVETQIYGRMNGKSCGWIGWSAPWGESEPVEIYWDRGRLTQEPKRWCSWG